MAPRALGQHWLYDRESLQQVVAAGEVEPDDTVLEIGPGHGTLTKLLAPIAKEVVAVEADPELVARLEAEITDSNVAVVHQDIREFNLHTLPRGYKVVANIPYYLTSKLLRMFLENDNPPAVMALLVQQEVADRITAAPGAMSVLALSVQFYGTPLILGTVSRDKFQPPPQVDSAILQIKRRPRPAFDADPQQLFRLIKAGFGERRKQLKNALAGGLRMESEEVATLLEQADIKPAARAQELSLEEWEKLYNLLYN